ncbi:MAG: hypothetical protein OHK0044_31910 [Burkholderiaceae bacterium]
MRIHGKATRRAAAIGLALAAGAFGAPAAAMNVCVRVAQYTETMPDGVTSVPMWGYRVASTCTAAQLANPASAINRPVVSPGAAITVPPGDSTLNITLVNRASANTALGERALPVPTSIVLHGHNTTMAPVFKTNATVNDPGTTSDCTPGTSVDCRMRSFTREAAPGGSATYTYTNVKPGTYLYQSGTLPQIQVPMGLYGMLRKNAPATVTSARVAYPGAASAPDQYAFDNEIPLILSEVDPAIHAAVAAGTFTGSTIGYDPKYFRVHRYPNPPATVPAAGVISQPIEFTDNPARGTLGVQLGTRQLVRVINAGIQSRALTFLDGHWFLIAEDGNLFPYPREQYSAFLPAAKSADLWFTPTMPSGNRPDRRLAIFDRRLALTNNDANSVGGMLVRLTIAGVGTQPTVDASACATTGTQGSAYACTVTAAGSGAPVYSLDIAPAGMTIDAGTGAIAWTPNNDQAYKPLLGQTVSNPVQVRATDPSGRFGTASFSVAVTNVDDAPIARDDAYDVRGGALTATRSVLANDVDPDGDPFTAVTVVAAPTNGTVTMNNDGTFTFTAGTLPATGSTTTTFTYTATANGVPSAPATVTLTLYANSAPTAVDDVTSRAVAATTPTFIDVLANDYDVDGNLAPATLAIVGAPNRGGSATVVTAGCPVTTRPCIAYTSPANFRGTEAITYAVSDALGATSNTATARVNVQ